MQAPEIYLKRFHNYLERNDMQKNQHQEEGLIWCIERELNSESLAVSETEQREYKKGGLVAYEMGLGKTILMLGLFVSNFVRNTLIVVPLPLLTQWKNEIKRTLGHDVLVYHGPNKKNITKEMLKEAALVLTTYGALHPTSKRNQDGFGLVCFAAAAAWFGFVGFALVLFHNSGRNKNV